MIRKPIVRRLGVVSIAAGIAACTSQSLPSGSNQKAEVSQPQGRYHVAQAFGLDVSILEDLPPAIPAEEAESQLDMVSLSQISGSFQADVFTGQTGTYRGFPPGFTAQIVAGSRFLRTGNILVPYTLVEGSYVPLVFADQDSGIYFYPALMATDGFLVPVYYVVRTLLGPYSIVLPVSAPARYVSPITIILVPAPIVIRPIIIRPRPRPRPTRPPTASPSPAPTMAPTPRPTRPPTTRPTRPPRPTAAPTAPPTVSPTAAPTRPPRPPRSPRDRPRAPRPRDVPDLPGVPGVPDVEDRTDLPTLPSLPDVAVPERPAPPQIPTLPGRPQRP